jgi:hypothetical protein
MRPHSGICSRSGGSCASVQLSIHLISASQQLQGTSEHIAHAPNSVCSLPGLYGRIASASHALLFSPRVLQKRVAP